MKKNIIMSLILGVFIMFNNATAFAEHQLYGGALYNWWDSGHTFASSKVTDRAFDGPGYEFGYRYFYKSIGCEFNFDKIKSVNEEMFPNWYYKARLYFLEMIPEYRWQYDYVDFRFGVGLNYAHLKNTYGDNAGETLRGVGWVGLLGTDVYLTKDKSWFTSITAKYIYNDLKSNYYSETNFRVGGLKVLWTIGIAF